MCAGGSGKLLAINSASPASSMARPEAWLVLRTRRRTPGARALIAAASCGSRTKAL